MPPIRPGRRQDAFKFHGGYNIRPTAISIIIGPARVKRPKSRRQNDRPDIQRDRLFRVIEVDGSGRAELLAGFTLAIFLEVNAVVRIDCIFQGYGLRVWHVDRLALDQFFVINVIHLFGALFCTHTAGNAFFRVHIPGMLNNGYRKIALFTRNFSQFRKGEQLNVDMPADLDQFGSENSHGTVVGGKGLVQLGHGTADCR